MSSPSPVGYMYGTHLDPDLFYWCSILVQILIIHNDNIDIL